MESIKSIIYIEKYYGLSEIENYEDKSNLLLVIQKIPLFSTEKVQFCWKFVRIF